MRKPRAQGPRNGQLYQALAKTSAGNLKRGAERVEKLSPEDAEAYKRGTDHRLNMSGREVTIAFMWGGFWFAVLVAVALFALLSVLLWAYGAQTIKAGSAGAVIGGILQFLFGVAFTLAIERLSKLRPGAPKE